MSARTLRILSNLCCVPASLLVTVGTYYYVTGRMAVEAVNTAANVASLGAIHFKAPIVTSNAFYIAGLFLALAACLDMKARHAARAANPSAQSPTTAAEEVSGDEP
jgi:TRAP-type C4-dicarboxylate transport system permease small subunit